MAPARAATATAAAVTAGAIGQVAVADRPVAMVAAEARSTATLWLGGRGNVDRRGEESVAAKRLEGTGGALCSHVEGELSTLWQLRVAKALEVVVLKHDLVLGEASRLGERVSTELRPLERVRHWTGLAFCCAQVRLQVQDGRVAP